MSLRVGLLGSKGRTVTTYLAVVLRRLHNGVVLHEGHQATSAGPLFRGLGNS